MGLWTSKEIWRSLSRDQRLAAAQALFEDARLPRAARVQALAPWLKARGMRLAFLDQLPRARRAQALADGGLPEETATQVLLSYHLVRQRPLLARFLDELGAKHEDGVLQDGGLDGPPPADVLRGAVDKIRAEFPAQDVDLYVRTLTAMDAELWSGLSDFAGDPE